MGTSLLITQRDIVQSSPCFSKHGFVRGLWRSRMQCTRLIPFLVRSGHNHRCCEL